MTRNSNPFLIYGYDSPKLFCDRVEETSALTQALLNSRNVTLTSIRRMGKTGLIQNCFYHLKKSQPQIKCFYLDIFSTYSLQQFTALFAQTILGSLDSRTGKWMNRLLEFFKSCRPVISNDIITGAPTVMLDFMPSNTDATLKEIFAYIKESGKECIIAIDEFQQITEYPEKGTEALLRSLMQFVPNAHFIFSGSKRHIMHEMFSSPKRPFYQSTQKLNIDVIPCDIYSKFARKHLSARDIELNEEVFSHLYDKVYGHTWYVQRILNKIYEVCHGEVSIADVDRVILSIIKEEEYNYQQQYSILTQNQQSLLRAVAAEGTATALNSNDFTQKYGLGANSSINRAKDFLISNEILLQTSQGYQVYDRFYRFWLARLF